MQTQNYPKQHTMNHKKLASRKSAITHRRLGVERLQARVLLAGDVTAAVTNGFLVIRGDDAANELTIERISGDRVQVTGATGTTINGLTQPAVLRVRKGYDIATGGGDDKLTVIGLNAFGRYEIRMDLGIGNDTMVARNLLAQRIHAGGGDGNDSITVRNSRSRRGSGVGGGAGDDTLVLENLRFGNGSCIDGGTGNDILQESNNRYGVRSTKLNIDPNTPIITPPTALGDAFSVVRSGSNTVNLANNDTAGTSAINRNSIVISTQPTNGSVTVNTDGNVTYLHNGSNTTSDSFAYTIKDTNGLVSAAATVSVTITPATTPPTAVADAFSVVKSGSTTVNLANNDTAGTSAINRNSIVISTQPTNGSVTVNTDGNVTYLHNGSNTTSDSFAYTIKDTNGLVSAAATVSVTVTPATNQAPVAVSDTASVVAGGSVNVAVLSNDTDVEGNIDVTSVVIVTQPANGTVGVNTQTGVVNYVHNGGLSTSDSFTYTFRDTQGAVSNSGTVSITILRRPVANDDVLTVQRGDDGTLNVIANDTAPSGTVAPASVTIVTQPTRGTVTALGNGQISYQHDGTATTTDQFTYTITDSNNNVSLPGIVRITITPVNQPPVTAPDTAVVNEGESVDVPVLANDTIAFDGLDASSVTIVTAPTRGTAVVLSSGVLRYTHNGSETSSDFLLYTVRGNNGLVSPATRVDITINPINDGPNAINDQANVAEGGVVNIPVLANDTDSDNAIDTASVVIINSPTNGTAVLGVGGVVGYTHNGSESTIDSFTYRVSDVSGKSSNLATVSISISPVNDPPVAVNDTASIASNVAAIVDIAANDLDLDDGLDLTSIEIGISPAHGTLTIQTDGKVTYVHNGSEATQDTFTYRIRDKAGALSNTATVSLSITLVNQPPIAVADNATIAAPGGQVEIDVAANDSDPDGGLNLGSVVIVRAPSNGTAVVLASGSIRYTHDGSAATSDSFTYKIRDFAGELSNEATVTLTVLPIA
ncbi:MAG: tandem-95 repeat protein [Planctomycetota bacterium]|nr:MAG: tandem-95 repeat protein [Planctomycetota bacterium]